MSKKWGGQRFLCMFSSSSSKVPKRGRRISSFSPFHHISPPATRFTRKLVWYTARVCPTWQVSPAAGPCLSTGRLDCAVWIRLRFGGQVSFHAFPKCSTTANYKFQLHRQPNDTQGRREKPGYGRTAHNHLYSVCKCFDMSTCGNAMYHSNTFMDHWWLHDS